MTRTAKDTTEQPTIEVEGYFRPQRVTREKFIQKWVNHASELSNIMLIGSLAENVRESAGNRFDEIHALQTAETNHTHRATAQEWRDA